MTPSFFHLDAGGSGMLPCRLESEDHGIQTLTDGSAGFPESLFPNPGLPA